MDVCSSATRWVLVPSSTSRHRPICVRGETLHCIYSKVWLKSPASTTRASDASTSVTIGYREKRINDHGMDCWRRGHNPHDSTAGLLTHSRFISKTNIYSLVHNSVPSGVIGVCCARRTWHRVISASFISPQLV
jgi:hypothetical protein